MGDGIVWYHPCGYLFKKVITSFYTYLFCLLNFFLVVKWPLCYSLEIWCICCFTWVSSRIFKSYCWLKLCQSIILIVLWVPKVWEQIVYICVYIFMCFYLLFLKLFKKNIQSCQFSPPILLRTFLLPLLILWLLILWHETVIITK